MRVMYWYAFVFFLTFGLFCSIGYPSQYSIDCTDSRGHLNHSNICTVKDVLGSASTVNMSFDFLTPVITNIQIATLNKSVVKQFRDSWTNYTDEWCENVTQIYGELGEEIGNTTSYYICSVGHEIPIDFNYTDYIWNKPVAVAKKGLSGVYPAIPLTAGLTQTFKLSYDVPDGSSGKWNFVMKNSTTGTSLGELDPFFNDTTCVGNTSGNWVISNSVVDCANENNLQMGGATVSIYGASNVTFYNVTNSSINYQVYDNANLTANNCSFGGLNSYNLSTVEVLNNSVISATPTLRGLYTRLETTLVGVGYNETATFGSKTLILNNVTSYPTNLVGYRRFFAFDGGNITISNSSFSTEGTAGGPIGDIFFNITGANVSIFNSSLTSVSGNITFRNSSVVNATNVVWTGTKVFTENSVLYNKNWLILNVTNSTPGTEYSNDSSMVGHWSFNEGTGGTTADLSGNGNTGTLIGATWNSSGKFGSALTFDGVNDYVNTTAGLTTRNFSIVGWVKLGNPDGLQASIFSNIEGPSYTRFLLECVGGVGFRKIYAYVGDGSTYDTIIGPAPTGGFDTNWHQIGVTVNSTTLRFIWDGVVYAATSGGLTKAVTAWTFQMSSDDYRMLNGTIDEVAIYNRTLTSTEIYNQYWARERINASVTATRNDSTVDYSGYTNSDTLQIALADYMQNATAQYNYTQTITATLTKYTQNSTLQNMTSTKYLVLSLKYSPGAAPSIILYYPENNKWNATRNINFTFYLNLSKGDYGNYSLWTNATGTWQMTWINITKVLNDSTNWINYTLPADGDILWNIQANDSNENSNFSSSNFTTKIDTTAPSQVTGLLNVSQSNTWEYSTWNAATDSGIGVAGYIYYRNGTNIYNTTQLQYNDTSLTEYTDYNVTVSAFDSLGHIGLNATYLIFKTYGTVKVNVTLISPADNAYSSNQNINFTFLPFVQVAEFTSCALWTNESGVLASVQANQSSISNNNLNGIAHTITYSTGAILWKINCTDSTTNSTATGTRVINIGTAPVSSCPNGYRWAYQIDEDGKVKIVIMDCSNGNWQSL